MKRRDFLGRVGWILAALGLSEAGWLQLGDRYYEALAQPTPRKLALLVGINQYSSTQALSGCLTDVELQRELLIHRFGFKAEDILTLTEQQATRQQIEAAFQEHLTKQAKPSDVVVFHFSGYGRRIQLIEEQSTGELHPSPLTLNGLVPVDGVMPTSEVPVMNDLLEETLWLLLRSLPTSYVTTILDTSFNNAPNNPLQGNLRVRSFPQQSQTQISAAELTFQQQLRQNLKLCSGLNRLSCGSIDNLLKPTYTSIMPGVVLAAAGSTDLATEAKWNGFSSGLFTYALTQYLWEATPPTTVQVSLSRVTGIVEQLVGKEQQPQLSGQKSQEKPLLAYHLQPDLSEGADGVVLSVEDDGKTARLWLAGLPLNVLEYFTAGSKLTLVPSTVSSDHSGQSSIEQQVGEENHSPLTPHPSPLAPHLQLQMRSRTGLTAKAQITGDNSASSLQVGQLVQEAVRVLPRDISLTIALDASLERIERVDATSAFSAIPHVSLVTAGEQQPADYVFGRVPETKTQESPATLLSASPPSRYGLFSLGQELIPNSSGEAGEAVKVAAHRLVPKLQTLLAAKLWRLTANEGSSQLNVKAKLELINAKQQAIAQRETLRSPKTEVPVALTNMRRISSQGNIPTLPIGSRIQYRIHNDSDRPLYLLLLGLDSSKSAIAFYSTGDYNSTDPKPLLKNVAIAPGETLIVPQTSVDFEWVVHGPPGLAENQLIFSTAKFTQTITALEVSLHPTGKQQQIGPLLNPLEVTQALMQDLHNGSAAQHTAEGTTAETISSTSDTYTLDVNNWASLSFIYQVI
ncbi:caspase family protein [Chroococcidiopsis sp. CCMEE 29]|uniref:caspase family protein n=1 Tax=Chroococcidiopsis sp. CCMEE 29 TaxID=155894 RepID=UPI00201FBC7F|nr:caspase family protein [Chroococcidiopsis sp. CCMEE 29]